MRISISPAAAIGFFALLLPLGAGAQVNDNFSWGVTAGAAVPTRDLATDHNTGVSAGITLAMGSVGQALGFRIDGTFNRFGAKSGTTAGDPRILGGTFNVVMPIIGESEHVYLIGGVGGYGYRSGNSGESGVNDFGLNGGIGLWLPGVGGFVEARYHHFYRALPGKHPATFIPITLGILF